MQSTWFAADDGDLPAAVGWIVHASTTPSALLLALYINYVMIWF